MVALSTALLAAAWLGSKGALALNYTVHGSVIFARTGEHTPFLGSESVIVTSYGANQLYNLVCLKRCLPLISRYSKYMSKGCLLPQSLHLLHRSARRSWLQHYGRALLLDA